MRQDRQFAWPRDDVDSGDIAMISYHYDRPSQETVVDDASWTYGGGYCDQPMGWRTRLVGLGGTLTILALVAGLGLLGWQVAESVILSTPTPLVVVNLRSFEAPPELVREVPDGPEQIERQEAKPEPKPDVTVPEPLVRFPVPLMQVREINKPAVKSSIPDPPFLKWPPRKASSCPRANGHQAMSKRIGKHC